MIKSGYSKEEPALAPLNFLRLALLNGKEEEVKMVNGLFSLKVIASIIGIILALAVVVIAFVAGTIGYTAEITAAAGQD